MKNYHYLASPSTLIIRYLHSFLGVETVKRKAAKFVSTGRDLGEQVLEDLKIQYEVIDPAAQLEEAFSRREGKTLVFSNHPMGLREGFVLFHLSSRYAPIRVVVRSDMGGLPFPEECFVLLSEKATERYRDFSRFNAESHLLYFPAGKTSRWARRPVPFSREWRPLAADLTRLNKAKGRRCAAAAEAIERQTRHWKPLPRFRDGIWGKGFLRIARSNGLNLLPIHISGHNSRFFYGLSALRKGLGIRYNIESAFLLREFLYGPSYSLKVHVGQLIPADSISRWPSGLDQLWSLCLRHYLYQLPAWEYRPEPFDLDPVIQSLGSG